MIINLLKGGLGNQLFQYAAGKCLSIFHKTNHALDISMYCAHISLNQVPRNLDIFDLKISAEIAGDIDLKRLRPSNFYLLNLIRSFKNKYIYRYYLDWRPEIFSAGNDLYLDGYFQSEKYFLACIDDLSKEFSLQQKYIEPILSIRNKINTSTTPVSIHIRRGDYVKNPRMRNIYDVCSVNYYSLAISNILNKYPGATFFIFTDDVDWVKSSKFIFPNSILVSEMKTIAGDPLRPSQELFLMSQCQHNIIANSSFSWWGAYLNKNLNKIVIAPNIWNKSFSLRQSDIVPENWLRIKVK